MIVSSIHGLFSRATPILSRSLIFLFVVIFCAAQVQAAEVIKHFQTLVEVSSDGSLVVTETIQVQAEGNQIKRGIYRDIPLQFEDRNNKVRQVGFDLLSVKRNGKTEPHFTEDNLKFTRIYVGDKNVMLPVGPHTFELKYQTDRQIRSFDAYDEIFWNATGNGWDFPINEATAIIDLPDGAVSQETVYFTGRQGERATNAKVRLEEGGNRIIFDLTAQLGPREGLTVGVKMKKGVILPPTSSQESLWFWQENGPVVIAFVTFLMVLGYYLWAWNRVGRDPEKGVVVPRWTSPDGISPALTAYIHKKGFSGRGWDALSGAVLNLAVKGYVELDNLSEDLVIRRTGKVPEKDLHVGERAMLRQLGDGGAIFVDKNNSAVVQNFQKTFVDTIEKEHRSEFYKSNLGWISFGITLTALGLGTMMLFANLDRISAGILIFTLFAGVLCMAGVTKIGQYIGSSGGLFGKIQNIIGLGVFGAVVFPNILAQASSWVFDLQEPVLLATIVSVIMINTLFYFLLGAPTPIGRKMMDGIEGLKIYLELAEKDRMNLADAPTMSPKHFETLLPYAVALGLEKPWSEAFDGWLQTAAGVQSGSYDPGWQRGYRSGSQSMSESFGSFGNTMSSSFTASMPVPKSSSSGFSSGGSSGGGGGGGGGGGW